MEGLFANLMRVTLNMSALAALTLLCTPLLKKRYSANWRYWVWMVIAIRLLIPFQMPAIELPDLKEPFQAALSFGLARTEESEVAGCFGRRQPGLPGRRYSPKSLRAAKQHNCGLSCTQ